MPHLDCGEDGLLDVLVSLSRFVALSERMLLSLYVCTCALQLVSQRAPDDG
jgi:hypothetical protein